MTCVFVDHGLLRKDEGDEVEGVFGPNGQFDLNFIRVNAQQRYYDKLAGVTEPTLYGICVRMKKPLIAMYGPTKADRTGPYGSDDATVILSTAACAGCLKKECDDWHCMYDITPEMVYAVYIEKSRRL